MSWFKKTSNGWQRGDTEELGDVQRYLYDAYQCKVYITNISGKKITVSCSLYIAQFGTCIWQEFWKFNANENRKAKDCFKEVKKISKDIFDSFKTNDTPNTMIYPYLRNSLLDVYSEYKPTSRNIIVDQSRRYKTENDWRSSLYGNRYPESDGF